MTVWRDLKALDEQGLIERVQGGARHVGSHFNELDFESKRATDSRIKAQIARCAVERYVQDGEVIAMEGGSTVAALVDMLPQRGVSIITNSLPIGQHLRNRRPALPTRILGGWINAVSGNTTGPDALRYLEKLSAGICFLSATGWDVQRGPLDPNPMEIEVKRALAAISKKVILLLDASKFKTASASVMIHPSHLHAVITNKQPDETICQQLEQHDVELVIVCD
jgi:DeoR/GlpR family transcriptional regulator of sugar metabolism